MSFFHKNWDSWGSEVGESEKCTPDPRRPRKSRVRVSGSFAVSGLFQEFCGFRFWWFGKMTFFHQNNVLFISQKLLLASSRGQLAVAASNFGWANFFRVKRRFYEKLLFFWLFSGDTSNFLHKVWIFFSTLSSKKIKKNKCIVDTWRQRFFWASRHVKPSFVWRVRFFTSERAFSWHFPPA